MRWEVKIIYEKAFGEKINYRLAQINRNKGKYTKAINATNEKIEIKTIKGLNTYFNNLKRKIQDVKGNKGGGGGGMGNVTHKTFDVGSTTTSSSLGSKVAADGNAIWARYQGQMLVKDTHYTISGQTITWLETFSDNTYVDVTYIRS